MKNKMVSGNNRIKNGILGNETGNKRRKHLFERKGFAIVRKAKREGEEVKITIHSEAQITETEVTICCNHLTPEIEKMISMLRMLDRKLTGIKDGETYLIDVDKVLYIDTVDKKTFLYTMDSVYETNLRLYELEEQLASANFFRANKSCIINFREIVSLKADLDRRIRVTLTNKEQLIVSRQYAEYVKQRLGVK